MRGRVVPSYNMVVTLKAAGGVHYRSDQSPNHNLGVIVAPVLAAVVK